MRYEVNPETFVLEVFSDGNDVPFLRQPGFPDGTPWESAAEAEAWAVKFIAAREDSAALSAPISRGVEGTPKPTPEQIAAHKAKKAAKKSN